MKLPSNVNPNPQHIAIIMDGNGRWAQRRGKARVFGHVRGASRVKSVVTAADKAGVQALTLFAFSTENWFRPESELKVLWKILRRYLLREAEELNRNNVRLRVIGEIERLAPDLREIVQNAIEKLSGNTGLQLTFAISYGARNEILQAAYRYAKESLEQGRLEKLTESKFERYLGTGELGVLGDVDLVIRTSGEQRVSNFLLWQSAYAEFYFTDVLWPDFDEENFQKALISYRGRERRFGRVVEGSHPGVSKEIQVGTTAVVETAE